ncbi:hypothetical protein [Streptomyces pratensis]|uniref:hypothetical protein n=1 Tax=Streptomyces pratensis TaxID=1169025 RepID=UPI00301715C9
MVQQSLADEAEEAEEAEETVRVPADGSAPALAATKRLLREAGEPPRDLEARLGAETVSIADLLRGPDGHEGLSAFLDKRV